MLITKIIQDNGRVYVKDQSIERIREYKYLSMLPESTYQHRADQKHIYKNEEAFLLPKSETWV